MPDSKNKNAKSSHNLLKKGQNLIHQIKTILEFYKFCLVFQKFQRLYILLEHWPFSSLFILDVAT